MNLFKTIRDPVQAGFTSDLTLLFHNKIVAVYPSDVKMNNTGDVANRENVASIYTIKSNIKSVS